MINRNSNLVAVYGTQQLIRALRIMSDVVKTTTTSTIRDRAAASTTNVNSGAKLIRIFFITLTVLSLLLFDRNLLPNQISTTISPAAEGAELLLQQRQQPGPPPLAASESRSLLVQHPFSTLYECTRNDKGACNGVSNAALIRAAYSFFEMFEGKTPVNTNMTREDDQDNCATHKPWHRSAVERWSVVWPTLSPPSSTAPAPPPPPPSCVELGRPFTFKLIARDNNGARVCRGGDYVEALVIGETVRARVRSVDNGNGIYTLRLLLPDDARLVGDVNLTMQLLFQALGGLARSPSYNDDYVDKPILPPTPLRFERAGGCSSGGTGSNSNPPSSSTSQQPQPLVPPTRECSTFDFTSEPFWDGHWLRATDIGRESGPCALSACTGALPSNVLTSPWVYRLRNCLMRLYDPPAARMCMNGSWLFSSGDSNFLDTAGNILNNTLGLTVKDVIDMPAALPRGRSFDVRGQYPNVPDDGVGNVAPYWNNAFFSFRIGNVWNAAPFESGEPHMQCCHGVALSSNPEFRGKHEGLLRGPGAAGKGPDIIYVNSGLHDGMRYSLSQWGLRDFASDVIMLAVPFWRGLRSLAAKGQWGPPAEAENDFECQPRMFWRSTVAPAGVSRQKRANPQFVEIMNRIVASALQAAGFSDPKGEGAGADDGDGDEMEEEENDVKGRRKGQGCARPHHTATPTWSFLDAFDLTFPFHMDNKWSDGGHYGRHYWAESDHVDRMLIQTLLNGLGCK